MKIQYVSDLHLEFSENLRYITENPIIPSGDILLMAGDILCLHLVQEKEFADFFQYISDHWKQVIWIPGNHEYYGNELLATHDNISKSIIHNNITLVNNITITIENVRIVSTTLWSKLPKIHTTYIANRMNDFRAIKYNGNRLTTDDYNHCHEVAVKYLNAELNKNYKGATIVLSHHVPTRLYYPPQYAGDILNYAFATELDYLIETSNIHAWIYGHHHQYVPAFEISNTAMLTNQLGYIQAKEHHRWRQGAIIEI